MKKIIETVQAPKAIGPYSQAVQVGNAVYLSGQIPLHPQTMQLVSDDIVLQAEQVFANLQAVCVAAGGSLKDIVKLTLYLTDLGDFNAVNEVMMRYFKAPYPARVTIQAAALPKSAKIEADGIMVVV